MIRSQQNKKRAQDHRNVVNIGARLLAFHCSEEFLNFDCITFETFDSFHVERNKNCLEVIVKKLYDVLVISTRSASIVHVAPENVKCLLKTRSLELSQLIVQILKLVHCST